MSKRIYDETLKSNRFQGRLKYVNPVNTGSNGSSCSCGTHARIKVGDTNNNSSNWRGKREIEE